MSIPGRIATWWSDQRWTTRLVLLCAASCLLLAADLPSGSRRALAQTGPEQPKQGSADAHFVGSQRCVGCHAREHADWSASQHKAAMAEATEATVLGNFDGATFSNNGIDSSFFKRDGKFWVRTDGPDGQMADFEIRYTFGVEPLQQYLIELPGGRMQALGIAWDTRPKADGGQRWYHLYPGRKLVAGDPLHWTGIDQNWNYQCAYCHSTNLQKNYDLATGQFKTTWSEISVGCEACHGPASNHLAWASQPAGTVQRDSQSKGFALRLDERKGVGWPIGNSGQPARSSPRTTSKEIEVCAPCHARRQQFSAEPGTIGKLFDAFRPSNLEAGLYHADGQQRDEVYTYGSFVQSRMHAAGVTCSDCHNPHSGKLHRTGNDACSQCHAPERFDTSSHHHHVAGSRGAECASCHMPTTTYMGVDARHDHSMRIPRPDRSVILATPNACNQCHTDKSAMWARDAIKVWYPAPRPGAQDFAEAFDLGDRRAPGAQAALLGIAKAETGSTIGRASAIARLRQFLSPQVMDLAVHALQSDDPALRTAAVAVVGAAAPATRQALLVPLLRDSSRLARMEAARALAAEMQSLPADGDRKALEAALAEYVEAQLFNAERPESHANLGALYRDLGRMEEAQRSFEKAIAIDPTFYAASISLADLVRAGGREDAAESLLRQALAVSPDSGPVHHALGLSLIRQKRTAEAMTSLAKAVELSPEEARFGYVLAVALHDTGKRAEAIGALKRALVRNPYDRDVLLALAHYEAEARDFASAVERAQLLSRLEPDRRDIAQLLASLKQRAR